jgi:DNA-binding LytR/AlgR family response regulator
MLNFIETVDIHGKNIIINTDNIIFIQAHRKGSKIILRDNHTILTSEKMPNLEEYTT